MESFVWGLLLRMFVCDLWFGILRYWSFVSELALGSYRFRIFRLWLYVWDLLFAISRLRNCIWELSLRIFRLRCFAWGVLLRIWSWIFSMRTFHLGYFLCDPSFCDLALEIFGIRFLFPIILGFPSIKLSFYKLISDFFLLTSDFVIGCC